MLVMFEKHPSETLQVGKGFKLKDCDPDSTPGYPGGKADGEALLAELDGKLPTCRSSSSPSPGSAAPSASCWSCRPWTPQARAGSSTTSWARWTRRVSSSSPSRRPPPEEKSYDFLWRIEKAVPAAGMVGVFDRSHYEDVLIHRVHRWASPEELERRYTAINEFEARQTAAGTKVVKVMLNISRDEQKERLLARLDDPAKHWKYSSSDLKERAFWDDYMDAYQEAFDKTSTDMAPWHVVPANKKWYARIAVQQLLLDALEGLKLQWPDPDFDVDLERELVERS